MANDNQGFSELKRVPLRQVGSHTYPDMHLDVPVEGLHCAIDHVTYVRRSQHSWVSWAAALGRPLPLFNWVSIYNFRPQTPEAWVFSIHRAESDRAEALMLVRVGHVVPCDAAHRGPMVYVGFIEVAPWNHPSAPHREIRGLGPYLLRAASDLSLQRGFEGRVGLHSVPAAESFYRSLGFTSSDCPNEYNELYMELDGTRAQTLLLGP